MVVRFMVRKLLKLLTLTPHPSYILILIMKIYFFLQYGTRSGAELRSAVNARAASRPYEFRGPPMPRVRASVAATGGRSKRLGATSVEVVEGSPTWFVILMLTGTHERVNLQLVHIGR